ncbi:MAG: cytochrome c3 family protein [Rhizobiaceae bacterium]
MSTSSPVLQVTATKIGRSEAKCQPTALALDRRGQASIIEVMTDWRRYRPGHALPGIAAVLAVILAAAVAAWPALAAGSQPSAIDVLAGLDIAVTGGAAAGYVPDAVCGECHVDKAEGFAAMGMAKSFYRPSPDKVIEDFADSHFFHEPSGRHYEMQLRDGEYWFRRYRTGEDGKVLDLFERRVDWILGSGHHTRTYLYQTADGALFELPLAWYSQEGKWRMAPGFEWARHLGVMRQVRRQCMFCHNAFPEVESGSDRLGMVETFPRDMPEGIGCQRCHGPGEKHLRALYSDDATVEAVREAIVNPGRLPRDKLYSVCYGCHMQPIVAVPPVRRFGRAAYSFRPGELLSDFSIGLDATERGRTRSDRFEINHHPYRLEQSRCFIESEGKLGCLTCHDPHRKIKPAERAAHYRKACLSCHGDGEGGLGLSAEASVRHPTIGEEDDCTTCHMPERRTQDVIHVTMTDHLIARNPGGLELIAPIEKKDVDIEAVFIRLGAEALSENEQTIYKAIATLRYSNHRYEPAAQRLEELLAADGGDRFEPWLELAESRLHQRDFQAAVASAREAAARAPDHPGPVAVRASALFSLGKKREAIALLEERPLDDAIMMFRLAAMQADTGRLEDALATAHKALGMRENLWVAWRLVGDIEAARGRHEMAADAFHAALAIEPDDERARSGLVRALNELGRWGEAGDYDR